MERKNKRVNRSLRNDYVINLKHFKALETSESKNVQLKIP